MNLKRLRKNIIIHYLGNSCQLCTYSKNPTALEFHHKEPALKYYEPNRIWGSVEKIKEEIPKCVLVCANCHREIHNGMVHCPWPTKLDWEVIEPKLYNYDYNKHNLFNHGSIQMIDTNCMCQKCLNIKTSNRTRLEYKRNLQLFNDELKKEIEIRKKKGLLPVY